ncbi:MAG TPA: ImmA/IrrE family metallo-endopeptidase [Thermoanaerobaculia bacterium]|nr:ImmA/IrrE family metallo-endopeptidase [Thermoanaerobaculia bacterium]
MTPRVPIRPALLRWACERAGLSLEGAAARFPKLDEWLSGAIQPTLKQVEAFASATHTPVGYLFLPEPPEVSLPIPDLRTMGSEPLAQPSTDLLETIYDCQQRQAWYREESRMLGESPLAFVGSLSVAVDPAVAAAQISKTLAFDVDQRRSADSWSEALRRFVARAEEIGVLVMTSGIVGSNTHRTLDPQEFRGFALADDLAPVVFVNGADTKAAQMFTLAHELAHLWLGASGVSDSVAAEPSGGAIERWCNRVAAELLVPLTELSGELRGVNEEPASDEQLVRLARVFKVSTLVIIRRLHDAGILDRDAMWTRYQEELTRLLALKRQQGPGGNFYATHGLRVSRRFARALYVSLWEGRASFSDARALLGIQKTSTFEAFAEALGVGR